MSQFLNRLASAPLARYRLEGFVTIDSWGDHHVRRDSHPVRHR